LAIHKKNFLKPQVTVILPFYENGEELDDAIASITNQTFRDWELLLINNNATPVAEAIADNWAANDCRIKQLYEPKQGIAHALNLGLKNVAGHYIARMDGDDISFAGRLAKQVKFLDDHPAISVVSTQTAFASELARSEGYQFFTQWQNSIITNDAHYLARFIESPIAHPTVMFRKKLIDDFGGYDTGCVPEDYELWLRWFSSGVGFYKIPEPLVFWSDHEQRISRNHAHYSKGAFFKMKIRYLAKWVQKTVAHKRRIVVCGSGKNSRKRAQLLQNEGVPIFGFTDVKISRNRTIHFIPFAELTNPDEWFVINFISQRGVGEAVKKYFTGKGFRDGIDFILTK
jgi:glycosyltransferase involved in cell wall biosynthesis